MLEFYITFRPFITFKEAQVLYKVKNINFFIQPKWYRHQKIYVFSSYMGGIFFRIEVVLIKIDTPAAY